MYKHLPLPMWRTDPQQLRAWFMAIALAMTLLSFLLSALVFDQTRIEGHLVLLVWLPSLALILTSLWAMYRVLLNFVVLQRREARLRRVARLGYWRYNEVDQTFEASPDVWRSHGLIAEEAHTLDDFLQAFKHAQERERFKGQLKAVSLSGGTFEMEALFVTRLGHEVWVALVGRSHHVAVEGSVQNITQRKEAEMAKDALTAYIQNVVDLSKLGIWELDLVRNQRVGNVHIRQMMGLPVQEGEGFMPYEFDSLVHPDDQAELYRQREDFIQNRNPNYEMSRRVRHAQGHWIWVFGKGQIVAHDAQGRPTLMRGIHIDITAIQEAREAAEAANRAKSEFLSRMSHELRTPLNSMLGYTQLLRMEGGTTERQEEHITSVLSGGRHLLNLVNDLLHITKFKPGEVLAAPLLKPISLLTLVQTCYRMLEPQAQERRITLNQDLRDGEWVMADALRLQQVIINLLSNAIKYGFEGSQVYMSSRMLGSGLLRLSVRDQGQGIEPGVGARVFEPFYRGTLPDFGYEGAGIGLTVCKQLMEGMNGHISYQSTVGVGSVFHVDLPTAVPLAQTQHA